jgi:hypothetical protein
VLAQLNGHNRCTRAGRRFGVNFCLYTGKKRSTINEGRIANWTTRSGMQTSPNTMPTTDPDIKGQAGELSRSA